MANKVFRFALGTPATACSGLWRVWTHEDEVHLAVHGPVEEVGLTMYPTGRWRITVGDAVSRWTRPKDFRPGWSRGPDLIIPAMGSPVHLPEGDPHAAEPVAWLPPAAPGFHARISLLVATPSAEASHWRPLEAPGTQSLATLPLRKAGTLHIVRIDEQAHSDSAESRAPVGGSAAPAPPASRLRVIVSADQAGCPSFRETYDE